MYYTIKHTLIWYGTHLTSGQPVNVFMVMLSSYCVSLYCNSLYAKVIVYLIEIDCSSLYNNIKSESWTFVKRKDPFTQNESIGAKCFFYVLIMAHASHMDVPFIEILSYYCNPKLSPFTYCLLELGHQTYLEYKTQMN